ncbi:MAG: hypothetical protein ACRDZ9_09215 [Acidimicrobiales bacterium]
MRRAIAVGCLLAVVAVACGGGAAGHEGGAAPPGEASTPPGGGQSTLTSAPSTFPASPRPGFIYRRGSQLHLDGEQYRFLGIVPFPFTQTFAVEGLRDLFGSLRPNSVISFYGTEDFAIKDGRRDWSLLDEMLRAARQAGHRVVLGLEDGNLPCDGSGSAKSVSWYAGGYRTEVCRGYKGLPLLRTYREWVREIVGRYKDSPAVAWWAPIGEPRVPCQSARVLRRFFDDVGAEIRRLDPDHLIASGHWGGSACGDPRQADYRLIHSSPYIDIADYHDYNYDDDPLPAELRVDLRIARELSKPLVIGDGSVLARAGGGPDPEGQDCVSLEARRDKFKAKLDAQFAAGVSGRVAWAYVDTPSGLCDYDIGPGDPLLALLRDYPL